MDKTGDPSLSTPLLNRAYVLKSAYTVYRRKNKAKTITTPVRAPVEILLGLPVVPLCSKETRLVDNLVDMAVPWNSL